MSVAELLARVVRERRSVRRFRPERPSMELLVELLELATWAPSAGNRQDSRFVVVTSPSERERIAAAVRSRWEELTARQDGSRAAYEAARYASRHADVSGAPVLILVAARVPGAVAEHMFGDGARAVGGGFASAAMAAQNLLLAAHAAGLGACCMTAPLAAAPELSQIAGLGRRHELVCVVALGAPDELPAPPERRPLQEVVRFMA